MSRLCGTHLEEEEINKLSDMLFFFFSQNRKVKGSPSEARSYLALEEDCRSREYYFNNKIKSLLHSVLPLFHPGH